MAITILDALMGQGKTTCIFNIMRRHPEEPYIYIGIDLEQGEERPQRDCPELGFRNPIARGGVKRGDLHRLVEEGANIGSTHQLFRRMNRGLYEALKDKGYTLVIDEALDVVSQYKINPTDLRWLENEEAIYVEEGSHLVRWNHAKWPKYDGKFQELVGLCDNGNLVQTRGEILMWTFPVSFLDVFKDIYILTYMFEGQCMADYFKANNVAYQLCTLKDDEIVDYGNVDNQKQKEQLGELIRLDVDPYRIEIGKKVGNASPFTETWYKNRAATNVSFKLKRELYRLKNSTASFFREHGSGAATNMWSTFKTYAPKLRGPRYGRDKQCFVPMNAKATDKWAHKQALAYLVDRRQSPIVTGYFDDMGIPTR